MGKYDPLTEHLAGLPEKTSSIQMAFAEVEALVGALPASARSYRPWWGNSSHVQAQAWRNAGWHVDDVNLIAERVTFGRGRVGGSYAARRAAQRGSSSQPSAQPPKGASAEKLPTGPVSPMRAQVEPSDVAFFGLLAPMANWSDWVPFKEAVATATLRPGVYMARTGCDGPLVYIGMAAERKGRGVRGRLETYGRGKGAVSGLGEACLDRALGDAEWVEARLVEVTGGCSRRAKEWARLAVERADLHVCWAEAADGDEAQTLESSALAAVINAALWNRRR